MQRHKQMSLGAGRGVAVREFPMAAGHRAADCLLFVDGKAVGVVEACGRSRSALPAPGHVGLSARPLLLWSRDEQRRPELVGLFERTAPWRGVTASELAADGYPPCPEASAYLVTAINAVATSVEALLSPVDDLPLPGDSRPVTRTWESVACPA